MIETTIRERLELLAQTIDDQFDAIVADISLPTKELVAHLFSLLALARSALPSTKFEEIQNLDELQLELNEIEQDYDVQNSNEETENG